MKTIKNPLLLLVLFLLTACGGQTPAVNQPVSGSSGGSQVMLPAVRVSGDDPANKLGGPGGFNLSEPAAGLDSLSSYRAVLQMTFTGARQRHPYYLQKIFTQVVDREQGARLLLEESTDESAVSTESFSARIGPLRFAQAGKNADCRANLATDMDSPLFDPAHMLPHLIGAEEAGQETIGGVAADVYLFDQRALGLDGEGIASGKIWIAQDGGWVVKYELSLTSNLVFGAGISGEQYWLYEVSEVGEAQVELPKSCPQLQADFPIPGDAEKITNLPGYIRYTTGRTEAELAAFYEEQLTGLGWSRLDAPPEVAEGSRWAFLLAGKETQQIALIRARPAEGGSQVTVFQVETEIAAIEDKLR